MPETQQEPKADIVDIRPFQYEKMPINESIAQESNTELVVKGVLQRAEAKNQNGRVYPKKILKREAKKYEKNFINERRALGELDHPDSQTVNLKNVSHIIRNIEWNGNDLIGEVQILTTPSGNILKSLLEQNVNIGISSRGMGSVREQRDGTLKVGQDFELIAWDFVSNPSTHGAFMSQLNESVNPELQGLNNKWNSVEGLVHDIILEMSDEYKTEEMIEKCLVGGDCN